MKRAMTASPTKLGRSNMGNEKIISERMRDFEMKKQALKEQEKQMIDECEQLKMNLERMNGKQQKLLKIQELRQRHHALEMEEAKLSILNASQKVQREEHKGGNRHAKVDPGPTAEEALKIEQLRGTISNAKKLIHQ